MWNYLGETLLQKLKDQYDHKFSIEIQNAQRQMIESKIGGHQAAQQIIDEIFKF